MNALPNAKGCSNFRKLDELIKGVGGARTHLVNLENLSDEELTTLQAEFARLRTKHATAADEGSVPAQ